ncbi:hypothetical protein QL285_066552 [Trifolium repens]|nr:hypothetical protein QL285_066552 [Trifolium repens]
MGVSNRQIWFLFYVAVGCSRSASFVTFWFWCDERRHSLPPPSRSAPELLSLGLVLRVVAGFVLIGKRLVRQHPKGEWGSKT